MVDAVIILLTVYIFLVAGYIVGSWYSVARGNKIYNLIAKIVEPPLSLLRRFVPKVGNVDISPAVLIFILYGIIKIIKIIS